MKLRRHSALSGFLAGDAAGDRAEAAELRGKN